MKPPTLPGLRIVGFFSVPGFGSDSVEVPCDGNGRAEYALLNQKIREKHPKVKPGTITRTGSVIERPDSEHAEGIIDLSSGQTIRQLFDAVGAKDDPRSSRVIGRVFFEATPCRVVLTFNRAGGSCGLLLLPRIKTGISAIPFPGTVQPGAAVIDLPTIVRDVLGGEAHALELNTRSAPAPAPVKSAPRKGQFQPKPKSSLTNA